MTDTRRRESFGAFKLSWCDDGMFDELVATGVDVQIERMDDGRFWFGLSTKDNRRGELAGFMVRKDGKKIDIDIQHIAKPRVI